MEGNPNIDLLERAAAHLEDLLDEVAFVGGCSIGMLVTDEAAPEIRPTTDVDIIVEIGSYREYDALSSCLRKLGFRNDTRDDAPLCRFFGHGITLDVMPTEIDVLGFSNRWYKDALARAFPCRLPSGKEIRVIPAPYLLGTKIEAFRGRGEGDYWSQDMEDIVALIDGRAELPDEVLGAESALREFLAEAFSELLGDDQFHDELPGHLPGDQASQARLPRVLKRIETIAGQ